ncbi:PREDICTED: maestro heat-like repeat-containing protein family member 6 [Ficedula albicollis]|uniref:maestro heat-like repeat-containing protein family member 6 n=1 Tax=Ficedula albicollis TaxID=59894 RepID=UPI0007AD819A|nr:PREDICTED: maestro heat-like repeat-containing protein family member 6 [Ficedula albicollis]
MANTDITATQSMANTKDSAPSMDFFGERVVSHPNEVPDFVRNMHQRLVSNASPNDRMLMDIVRLAEAHPADVAVTLLRRAPSCDRAARIMWRTIASSEMALEKVLPTLLCVLEDWPLHRVSASDGDKTKVFALAATVVVWEILCLPWCPAPFMEYSPRLLVALLFQVFVSTLDMPEEVNTFWKGYQEQLSLPISINRFAVQTVRALFRHLRCLDLLVAVERKCGWDTLLCAATHHYAMGLLAREMHRTSNPLCSCIAEIRHVLMPLCSHVALHLLQLLSTQEPRWDLPALAFLVEVLECHDMKEWSDSALEIISRRLQSKSKEKRRLALRGLVVLSKDPSLAEGIRSLTQSLMGLLQDADGEVVALILSVFLNELEDRATLISSPTALQLAEVLRQLFDYDNSHVPLLSIRLFRAVMELVMDKGKKPLKKHVSQSLLPLFFHYHDQNWHVAEASRETLLCAAKFLKRRRLKQLVKKESTASRETLLCAAKFLNKRDLKKQVKEEKLWKFAECLLAEDRSRAAEHLRQALPYLQSPQEPLREAAVRFIGRYLRKQQEETWLIYKALQDLSDDISPTISSLALQTLQLLRAAQRAPYSSGFRRCKTTSKRVGGRGSPKAALWGSLWKSMNN